MKIDTDILQYNRMLATIPIHCVNKLGKAESFGSGCFVEYNNALFFLTVEHNLKEKELTPCLLVDFDDTKHWKSKLHPLRNMNHFYLGGQWYTDGKELDFSFQRMQEAVPCKLLIGSDHEGIVKRLDRNYLKSDFTIKPQKQALYGFAGLVYPQIVNSAYVNAKQPIILEQHPVYYNELTYSYTEGFYHHFSMKNNDYEMGDFHGISGAPITDSDGNLVSLVVEGGASKDGENWNITGVDLSQFNFI